MRCDEFVDVACDVARGALADAARGEALAHAAGCHSCAGRLAAERFLDEALGMAARADTESAPDSVKGALLTAYKELNSPGRQRRVSSWRSKWFAAAATAALIAVVLLISLRVTGRRSVDHRPVPAPSPEIPLEAWTQEPTPGAPARPSDKEDKPVRRVAKASRRIGAAAGFSAKAAPVLSDSYALTDFIPLTHLSSSTAISSGQVIRVKVPLSALLPLGLPVSPEHADELVNAELVVGDDGVQRAVRLVR